MKRRMFIKTAPVVGGLAFFPFSKVMGGGRTHEETINEFVEKAFSDRLHDPVGEMKHPFIDPGAAYKGILWDWDAYFSLRGLQPWKEKVAVNAVGCIRNFLDFQREDGSIPYSITQYSKKDKKVRPNNSERNSAKPLMAQFALMAAEYSNDESLLSGWYEGLKKHCRHWEETQGTSLGLLTFRSHRGSGVDDHPAVYCRPLNSSIDVYLNSMMLQEYKAMQTIAQKVQPKEEDSWKTKAEELKINIEKHLWDPIDECYYNLDVGQHIPGRVNQEVTWRVPLKFKSWTCLMPLWAGAASQERAKIMIQKHLMDEQKLLAPSGMRSLSKQEPAYEVKISSNPSCWRGPIWVVNNFMVCEGLKNYGFEKEAEVIAQRIKKTLAQDITANGQLHEYYDPESGKGLTHLGFLNWNTLGTII